MRRHFVLLLLAGALSLSTASAEQYCPGDLTGKRCADQDADPRARLGLPTIAELEARGATVRRVVYYPPFGGSAPVITFIHEPGRPRRVLVSAPGIGADVGLEGRMDPVTLTADVPAAIWDDIINRQAPQKRDILAPRPITRPPLLPTEPSPDGMPPSGPPPVPICADGDDADVEAIGPSPDSPGLKPWLREKTYCPDDPAIDYAAFAAAHAMALFPQCAAIEHEGDDAYHLFPVLRACSILEGQDPLAAAAVVNQLRKPIAFTDDAVMDWPGEARAEGQHDVAALWRAQMGETPAKSGARNENTYATAVIRADSDEKAMLRGIVKRDETYAAIELVWVRVGDSMKVARVTVGPFAKQMPAIP